MAKIAKIEFYNHPIFKTTTFDFTLPDGAPADTITLAGENGSGKTKLLEELYFGTRQTYQEGIAIRPNRQTTIVVNLTTTEENYLAEDGTPLDQVRLISSSDSNTTETFYTAEFYAGGQPQKAQNKSFSLHPAYSTTEINFTSDEIPDILQFERFKNAFQYMFGAELTYQSLRDSRLPIFTKDQVEIDINSLSSGEKQIIFRTVTLLENAAAVQGSPVFIDEPELSMHPRWAHKIYSFYQSLFRGTDGRPTSQIFLATHSADVVKAAVSDDRALILSLCLDCQTSKKFSKHLAGEILPTITMAEVKYFVFDLPSSDFHVQLYSYIQNTFVKILAIHGVDDFLLHHNAPRKRYETRRTPTAYNALPTYIRNTIDHPDPDHSYAEEELKISIDFMIELIKKLRANVA